MVIRPGPSVSIPAGITIAAVVWLVASGRADTIDAVVLLPAVVLSVAVLRLRATTIGDVLTIRNFVHRYEVDRHEITRIGTARDLTWFAGWWPQERVVVRTADGRDLPIDATIGFRAAGDGAAGGPTRSRRWFELLREWIDERDGNPPGSDAGGPVPSPDGR